MPDSICSSTKSPRPAATLRIAALRGEAPRISTWSALSVSLPSGPSAADTHVSAPPRISNPSGVWRYSAVSLGHENQSPLTLRNHGDPGRVPPRLPLPSLDAHCSETDDGDCAVAVPEFDSRSDLRSRAFDAHCRVNPLFPGQREVKRRSDRCRILARI